MARVEREGAASGIRLTRNLGRDPSESFALGADAIPLIEDLCAMTRPLSFDELTARFEDWGTDSLAKIVDFLVQKEVLVALCAEPYAAGQPAP
jgi:hypothetical protein